MAATAADMSVMNSAWSSAVLIGGAARLSHLADDFYKMICRSSMWSADCLTCAAVLSLQLPDQFCIAAAPSVALPAGTDGMPSDSLVLEEEIDPNYVPTGEEICEYAKWLGMDLQRDQGMLWIAKEGLKAPLPQHWKPCKTVDTEEIYYFNFSTGDSTWDHPCDDYYRKLYEQEKQKVRGWLACLKRSTALCACVACVGQPSLHRCRESRPPTAESHVLPIVV